MTLESAYSLIVVIQALFCHIYVHRTQIPILFAEDFHGLSLHQNRDPKVFEYFDKETLEAFGKWNELVFKDGKLDRKTKELVAVACTYMTRCPYCIEGHTGAALKAGATREELAEVIQIAMALNAGACIAHRDIALNVELKE